MTSNCTCLILFNTSAAVWLPFILSDVDKEVNVPGKITKPANRIQVKNEARMLCSRGIVSRASSMSM